MHEAVELRPVLPQLLEQAGDLGVVAHVALVDPVRAEFGREFIDAIAEKPLAGEKAHGASSDGVEFRGSGFWHASPRLPLSLAPGYCPGYDGGL